MAIKKLKQLALLVIALLLTSQLKSQSIYFNFTNGTNTSYNLQDVRKITFDADLMNLHLWDGSVFSWNVSTIGYYEYNQSSSNVQELLNDSNSWNVAIFPNPTSTTLNVSYSLPKKDEITLALFDMQGKLILQKNLGKQVFGEHQETLDLTGIPQGIFFCRISGKQNMITKTLLKN